LAELAQLLKLAGISPMAAPDDPEKLANFPPQDDADCMDVDVDSDGSLVPTEENADYDYGINPTSRKGYEYNTDPYQYQGNAQIPVRYVPAKSGDNPLPLWNEGIKQFSTYLKEVEASRLRRHKPAKRFNSKP
jgi:hypothetical protein